MSGSNSLRNKSPLARFFIFLAIVFLSWSIVSFIAMALVMPIFGISLFSMPDMLKNLGDPAYTPVLKYMQATQAIALFIVPVLLYQLIVDRYVFPAKGAKNIEIYTWAVLIMWLAAPMIAWLSIVNKQMDLPESFAGLERWMKSSEQQAAELTRAFLSVSSPSGMLLNLVIIALLPAIGEEFLFRGVLNSLFTDMLKNKHVAILVTSVLFSAFHFQFFGFIPRMLMGMMLGYMLLWSGTIWVPVIAHLVNNGSAVLMDYLYRAKITSVNIENEEMFPAYLIILSALFTGFALYRLYRNRTSLALQHGEGLG